MICNVALQELAIRTSVERGPCHCAEQDKGGLEHLYVTYMVHPHIVFEVLPGGQAVHR